MLTRPINALFAWHLTIWLCQTESQPLKNSTRLRRKCITNTFPLLWPFPHIFYPLRRKIYTCIYTYIVLGWRECFWWKCRRCDPILLLFPPKDKSPKGVLTPFMTENSYTYITTNHRRVSNSKNTRRCFLLLHAFVWLIKHRKLTWVHKHAVSIWVSFRLISSFFVFSISINRGTFFTSLLRITVRGKLPHDDDYLHLRDNHDDGAVQ